MLVKQKKKKFCPTLNPEMFLIPPTAAIATRC